MRSVSPGTLFTALALGAAVVGLTVPAAALQAPAPAPSSQPMADASRMFEAMKEHLTNVRGDRLWPWDMSGDFGVLQTQITLGEMIQVEGEVTGPGGFQRAVSLSLTNSSSTVNRALGEGSQIISRGRADNGRIDLALGVLAGGEPHVGSVSGVTAGSRTRIDLGAGYAAIVTLSLREQTDREQEMNASMLRAMNEARTRTAAEAAAARGELPPAVAFSPYTNAVIREGDERAEPED